MKIDDLCVSSASSQHHYDYDWHSSSDGHSHNPSPRRSTISFSEFDNATILNAGITGGQIAL
jgi:hypothetical protein